jgi:hypothetical protein
VTRAWLPVLLFVSAIPVSAGDGTPPAGGKGGVCDALSKELFGEPATRPVGAVKPPKQVHSVKPAYPPIPAGTVASGTWVGEALIGPDGRVRGVSVLRDLKFKPPFPAFSKAISDAILQWKYTPTLVDGQPVPVCMTMSVNIHWR